jgi:hypothetical protein
MIYEYFRRQNKECTRYAIIEYSKYNKNMLEHYKTQILLILKKYNINKKKYEILAI